MVDRRRIVVASLVIAVVLLSACGGGGEHLPDPHGLALMPGDLPGFKTTPSTAPTPVGRSIADACPIRQHIPDGTPVVPKRCDFTGFLIETGLNEPGRQQIDAFEREGGNEPRTETPMLPVAGPFVATHSGIFEIYDYVMALSSDAEAHDEFVSSSYSRADQETDYRELPASLADERKMYRGVLGPDAANFQTQM